MYFVKATLFALFSAAAIPVIAGEGSVLGARMPPCDPTNVAATIGKPCLRTDRVVSAPPTVKARNTNLTSRQGPAITVINNTPNDIRVSVSTLNGDSGSNGFLTIATGASEDFSRADEQIVSVSQADVSGNEVQTFLGIPGSTVNIN